MAGRSRRPSPVLGTAATLIGEASDTLVRPDSRFRHSFEVPLDTIRSDPDQARKVFDETEIKMLAITMTEHGQLQPILLRKDPEARGRWIIVAGERRWRAALVNGWSSILAVEHDGDPEVVSLIENLQRVDLTPVEEARGLDRLIREKGWTQTAAAQALGRSKAEVSAVLRILTLPDDLQAAVLTSELPVAKNVLVELARLDPGATRDRLIAAAGTGTLTVRAVRGAMATERSQATDRSMSARMPGGTIAKTLDRIASRLQADREAGRPLRTTERASLLHLRQEIEQRLAAG
jgi:ParB family chromosome partitioning protein